MTTAIHTPVMITTTRTMATITDTAITATHTMVIPAAAAPAGFNGSTAVLFTGRDPADNARAAELAADLDAAGADVVLIGSRAVGKATCIRSPTGHVSAQMAHSVVIAEYFVSLLAA